VRAWSVRWHDGVVIAPRFRLVLLAAAIALGAAACGGMSTPHRPTVDTASADANGDAAGTNPFIPENRNLSECVSSLPRPDCGTTAQGGLGQALTFAVLMVGMALIGWRIAHSVRKRERAGVPDPADPADPVDPAGAADRPADTGSAAPSSG